MTKGKNKAKGSQSAAALARLKQKDAAKRVESGQPIIPGPQIDITQMDVPNLKALAFDQIQERDRAVNNLNIIYQELQKRQMQEIASRLPQTLPNPGAEKVEETPAVDQTDKK